MDQEAKNAALARLYNRFHDPEVEDITDSTGRTVSYQDYGLDKKSKWNVSRERDWLEGADPTHTYTPAVEQGVNPLDHKQIFAMAREICSMKSTPY
eukprot:COSAG02_NODE_925_length_15858_cov_4.267276_9_plen_96_part_00